MTDILSMSALEISKAIKTREISVKDTVNAVIKSTEKDSQIGAYLTLNCEDALKKSEQIQIEIDKGEGSSLLAGVPFGVKDNICTKGIRTTCASKMLCDFIPPFSATSVQRLENNFAILLGKLNMDEFAIGNTNETSYFKKTKNPWDKLRVPGGSSGGAAAAVAAREAIFALGSDTGGSVRQPASYCGVTGFKPSYSTVSRYGLIAHASSLDQIGVIAKDVADCAAVTDIIGGKDSLDSTVTKESKVNFFNDLTGDIKGLKIGIPTEFFEHKSLNREVADAVLKMTEDLKLIGADIIPISLPFAKYVIPTYYILSTAEASSNLSRYDGVRFGFRANTDKGLDDLYKKTRSEGFGDEVKRRIMLGTFVLSAGYYDEYYLKALKSRKLIKQIFCDIFKNVDAIVCPTAPTTAPKFNENLSNPIDMYLSDIFTVSANLAGLPALSVPCGFDSNGLPIGAQILGPQFCDGKVLNIGYSYQLATTYHKKSPGVV